jgi:DNA modification methylase
LSTAAPYHLATTKPIGDAEYVAAFAGSGDEGEETDISEHSFIAAFSNSSYRFVKRLSKQERRDWGYSSMWRITSVQGSKDKKAHHATFPVELPWRCIKMHSDKDAIVLEPFSGTFTTGIACEQLSRKCYAMEKDETYCDIAVKRYLDFTEGKVEVVLLRGGKEYSWEEAQSLC